MGMGMGWMPSIEMWREALWAQQHGLLQHGQRPSPTCVLSSLRRDQREGGVKWDQLPGAHITGQHTHTLQRHREHKSRTRVNIYK